MGCVSHTISYRTRSLLVIYFEVLHKRYTTSKTGCRKNSFCFSHPSSTPHQMNFLLSLVFLLCVADHSADLYQSGKSRYLLTRPTINEEAVSITAFAFYESGYTHDWVNSIFGSRAVYFNHTGSSAAKAKLNFQHAFSWLALPSRPLCSIELLGLARLGRYPPFIIRKNFDDVKARLGNATLHTLLPKWKVPSLSYNTSHWPDEMRDASILPWKCYYRVLQSNRRISDYDDGFWLVLFYCPATGSSDLPPESQCSDFKNRYTTTKGALPDPHFPMYGLSMELYNKVEWKVTIETEQSRESATFAPIGFHAAPVNGQAPINGNPKGSSMIPTPTPVLPSQATIGSDIDHARKERIESNASSGSYDWKPSMAVCTAWTYISSNPHKFPVIQALAYEFVRYYSNLGFLVMVYDRDGLVMQGAFDTDYARANPQRGRYASGVIEQRLVYHNYTIHSLLLPTAAHLSNGSSNISIFTTDMDYLRRSGVRTDAHNRMANDKELTYSHCRSELQIKYGITNVLVVDFDEFLYCKSRPSVKQDSLSEGGNVGQSDSLSSTPESQADLVAQHILAAASQRQEQMIFGKAAVEERSTQWANVSDRSLNCMIQEVNAAKRHLNDSSQPAGSIFNCWGALSKFRTGAPNYKSMHIARKCPYTAIHHACTISSAEFDCVCSTSKRIKECDIVHLPMTQRSKGNNALRLMYNQSLVAAHTPLELRIVNAQ